MPHDPLSPSEALRTPVGAAVAALSALTVAYSLAVAQLLLGLLIGIALPVGLYLSYRLFAALDALADAAQRIADTREREAGEGSRFDSVPDRGTSGNHDSQSSRSSDRITERER